KLLESLLVKKTYTINWHLDPKKGLATGGTWIVALPRKEANQSGVYEVSDAPRHPGGKSEPQQGLPIVSQGTQPFTLTTTVTVQPYSYKKELAKAAKVAVPRTMREAYMGSCEGVNPKSTKLVRAAAESQVEDKVATVRNILSWMGKNIHYKNESVGIGKLDFKNVDEILDRGHAECRGYTMLFVGLCRAAGIPARPVWGLARIPPSQTQPQGNFGSHNWA